MVDLRVDMIRPAGQYDAAFMVFFHKAQNFFAFPAHILSGLRKLNPCILGSVYYCSDRELLEFSGERGGNCLQIAKGHERIAEQDVAASNLFYIILDVLRVGSNDRAIIMVIGFVKLVTLVEKGRIEDKVYFLTDQPGHMSMRQFCGITFRFTGNGLYTQFIDLTVRTGREHDTKAQLREEGEPERVIFIHIQNARNADCTSFGLVGSQRFIGKEPFQLIVVEIRHTVFGTGFADTTLTAVAGDVLASSGKFIDGETAVIGAAFTFRHAGLKLQVHDLFDSQHGSACAFLITFSGDQRGAKGTHNTGDIRTDRLAVGNLFKAAEHSVVVESTALYNNVFTEFRGIGYFNDFEKRVLDHRVGKPGRDIRDGCPFFLCLLHLGIHEHGTPCSKVDRMLGKKCGFGKVFHAVI